MWHQRDIFGRVMKAFQPDTELCEKQSIQPGILSGATLARGSVKSKCIKPKRVLASQFLRFSMI